LFLLFLFLTPLAFSQQSQTQSAQDFYEQAMRAYQEKNYQLYAQNLEKVVQSGVNHPIIFYRLAGAYALMNNPTESVKWLNRLADLGLSFPVEEEEDFASLKDSAEFKAVLQRFTKNMTPTNNSQMGFTIPEKDFMAEGLTYDPVTELFYAASILKRKIVSIDQKGVVKEFSSPNDGLWCVLGMSVDAKRRNLWVASSAISELPGFNQDKGHAGIFQYDLKTGKLIRKFLIADTESEHVLGDVIVNSKGDVFTTDSNTPGVYWIPNGKTELEVFLGPDLFRSPQGLCFSPDEKTLFVADYSRGVIAIDIQTKAGRKLPSPANAVITGMDGFYLFDHNFIATQNGVKPNRVLRLIPDAAFTKIDSVQVLESNNKAFGEPTLGVIVNGWLYYVANNQLSDYLEGDSDNAVKLTFPIILKLNLQSDKATNR